MFYNFMRSVSPLLLFIYQGTMMHMQDRFQDQENPPGQQMDKAADLGHSRTRTL